MKLRLRENSIRLRLLQSEVEQLREKGSVSESIQFSSDQALGYTLKIDNGEENISASFDNGKLLVRVPSKAAHNWLETEEVGLEEVQVVHNGLSLNILLEKDFVCLKRPMEGDNLDAFPNPEAEPC